MIEFSKRVLKVNLYGEVYELSFPTMKQAEAVSKNEGDDLNKMYDLLKDLGLPKKVAEEMYPEDMQQLIETLMPAKKK